MPKTWNRASERRGFPKVGPPPEIGYRNHCQTRRRCRLAPYTRAGCFPLDVIGGAEPVSGPRFVAGSAPRSRAKADRELLVVYSVIREAREVARHNGSTVALVFARTVRAATALLSRLARIIPDGGSAAP